jgi:hypothetical protein
MAEKAKIAASRDAYWSIAKMKAYTGTERMKLNTEAEANDEASFIKYFKRDGKKKG